MEYLYFATFAASLLIAAIAVPLVRRIALKRKFVDEPGPRKIHDKPVALGGGIALLFAVCLPVIGGSALAIFLFKHPGAIPQIPANVAAQFPGMVSKIPQLGVILFGALVLFAVGLVDDFRGLGPLTKLFFQVLVAVFLVTCDVRLSLFVEGYSWGKYLSGAVTVLWMVAITNSFNLLDNMDGLSLGVAAIAGVAFMLIAVQTSQYFIALLLAALIGGCIGTLFYNFPPASVFIGDAGSLLIGYLMAVLTVNFTFYEQRYPLYSYFVPIAVLAVPMFDTLSVMFIRLRNRRPVFAGDTNHLSHRLVRLGMSRRAAVMFIYILTFCSGLSALMLYTTNLQGAMMVLVQVVCMLGLIVVMEMSVGKSSEV
jgi:UDP-GlcNAc:undecaprenyl-phosphate GlcNAc-1-phosphate transferase